MFTWLGLVKTAISLVTTLVGYLRDKKLIEGAEAKVVLKSLQEADETIKRVKAARDSVNHDAASVSNDPDNRDS